MNFIRHEIPIADVARELGIRVAGRSVAHCWRVGAHQNGDRTPSLAFRRNRAKCFVCDADSMSVIDLVIEHQEFEPSRALREATDWICARWSVPTIAKNTKLSRPERWSKSPDGLSSFPLERFVRSGMWAALDDAGRAILPVLFCFAEKGEVCVSYRALSRYSEKASTRTIAKALRQFKQTGILEALPKAGKGFRDAGRYRFTLDSPKFQAAISEVHARLKREIGAERELRAQSRALRLQDPEARERVTQVQVLSLLGESVSKVHVLLGESVHFGRDAESNKEKELISEDARAENKASYESAHFTTVKREDRKSGAVNIFTKSCRTEGSNRERFLALARSLPAQRGYGGQFSSRIIP